MHIDRGVRGCRPAVRLRGGGTSEVRHLRLEISVTYELTIDQKPTYLHIIVTGQCTRENVMQYMEDVIRECINRNYSDVLIEERLEGTRLGTFEVFFMVSEGAEQFLGRLHAIAYVDAEGDSVLMQFAENVAVNRGIPIQIFSNVPDAETWLLQRARSGS